MPITPEPFAPRPAHSPGRTLLAAAVAALTLASLPAGAQGTGGSAGSYGSGGTPGTMSGTATGAKLARDEVNLLTDLAQANIAEIETGRLALEKSQNPQVRKFAQQMIDDHTSAQQQLQTLAQSKGVTLTTETDLQHKTVSTALRVLSGDIFDSQYLKRVGVNDHQRTIALLQKTQRETKDADIQAMAGKMLLTVQGHLEMAQQMSRQMESRDNAGRSGNGR